MRTRQAFPPIGALMKIRDVLSPTDIIIDVRASDKTRLLEQLSTQAAAKSGLAADAPKPLSILLILQTRENSNYGVAL